MDERKWLIPENTVHNLTTISNLLRIVFWRGDRPGPDILRWKSRFPPRYHRDHSVFPLFF